MSKKAPVASGLAPSPEPARKSPSVNVLLPPAPQKTGDVQPEVIGETAVNTISVPGTADDWEEDGPEEIIVPTVAPVPAVAPVATPVTPVEPHVEGEEEEGDEEEDVEAPPPPPPAEDEEPEQLPVDPCIGPDHRKRHQFKKHEICIPDKARKPAPPPKVKPWYLQKKPDPLEKRQDSRIAFLMPKQQDPQVIALRKTNKMVQKLIKYMKKSWKVRINRKQAPRELEFRTLASVYTSKPEDWLDKIRQREDAALETGFFSAMDIPYEAHIDMELDTALLVFKNLPPDLKITAARWIRMRLRKEELKRKRDAYLPRLAHGRIQRPSYNKGRLLKDPGGVKKVDQFVKVAEGFQRVTRGNKPYSKVLNEWTQNKEKENYNTNSGFGVIHDGMFDFRGAGTQTSFAQGNRDNDDFEGGGGGGGDRRVSIVDARKYQRNMLYYEKMLAAIYNIMKSLLNIKTKQLESKFPLPPSAVIQLRGDSPESGPSDSKRKSARQSHSAKISMTVGSKKSDSSQHDHKGHEDPHGHPGHSHHPIHGAPSHSAKMSMVASKKSILDASHHGESHSHHPAHTHHQALSHHQGMIRKSLADFKKKSLHTGTDLKTRLSLASGPHELKPSDVINLSPVRSSKYLVQEIMKHHTKADLMDLQIKRKTQLTAEEKIKRLAENPEHAAIRRARNYMTYMKLFERNKKPRRPVWHDIDIAAMTMDFNSGVTAKDAAHLTEQDAVEMAELALQKRKSLSHREKMSEEEDSGKRWPEEYDIPTPTYPFPTSDVRIPSEEQSRQNLLKKTPHMDEIPGTPVRRLYKLAGVRTTEAEIFNNIMEMKKMFRVTENKCRVYYENEIGKLDWDTQKRFRGKLRGMVSTPVYHWTISMMREQDDAPGGLDEAVAEGRGDEDEEDHEQKKLKQKRPALWYKKLQEEAEINGATRHNGCHTELHKLLRYCDVDMKTKPHMLNRLALLVVSLPTTELATKQWQQGIVFLLEFMFGAPPEIIHDWLNYRGLPYLL